MISSEAARIFKGWAACEGLMADVAQTMLPDSPEFQEIEPVTEIGKQLLRSKQISGIAFNDAAQKIVVLTKRTAPASKRMLKALPNAVADVSILYRQGVQQPIGTAPASPFGSPPYVVRQLTKGGVYTCGSSISVGNFRDAGTLGCLVRDVSGALYGLSNNHVSASCSCAPVGMPIVAPGIHDVAAGGLHPFTLALHHAALPVVPGSPDNVDVSKNLDAAIFRIVTPEAVSSFQGSAYDTPHDHMPLSPGLAVEKVGRTSGHTKGTVVGQMHGPFGIGYSAALYGFTGQVHYDPLFIVAGLTGLFSDHGDSGSLVTTIDAAGTRFAVGIVVGGMADGSAPGGRSTLILPVEPILAALGVSLVTGHNV